MSKGRKILKSLVVESFDLPKNGYAMLGSLDSGSKGPALRMVIPAR